MATSPDFPSNSEHIAMAGKTGSGKTTGALEMLSHIDMKRHPMIVIDHKRDSKLKLLPAEKMSINPVFLPAKGLHIVRPKMTMSDREDLEELLVRVLRKGNIGIYVDEGHLMGMSNALRNILVSGRDKNVNVMWISQRASWIDTFIWSQSTYYRVWKLQTMKDLKAVQDNWPVKFQAPEQFHSWYYDGEKVWYLLPAGNLDATLERLDRQLRHSYRAI